MARNKLYRHGASKKHTYFYSTQFVGTERPFISFSDCSEYFEIRDWFLEYCEKGAFDEPFGILPGTSCLVRRIDLMKQTSLESTAAKTHLRNLQKDLNALNNPERPLEPQNLLKFMEEREVQLQQEAEQLEFQLMTERITYDSKEKFFMKVLERKYSYIYSDLQKQWKHLNEDKENNEPQKLRKLEVA